MGLSIPGLSDALDKLDGTEQTMNTMVARLDTIIALMIEQNSILREQSQLTR